jgi:hypothetical protein
MVAWPGLQIFRASTGKEGTAQFSLHFHFVRQTLIAFFTTLFMSCLGFTFANKENEERKQ